MKAGITFDDVLIIPAYSDISSRSLIDLNQTFLGIDVDIPIISANMDYITGVDMAIAMCKESAFYILHRFMPLKDLLLNLKSIFQYGYPLSFSVGTRDPQIEINKVIEVLNIDPLIYPENVIVTVDVAHGHHKNVEFMIKELKSFNVKVIAGNIATGDGYKRLAYAGADAIKVGIGPGSVCTTRTVTGVGIPQLTAIMDTAKARDEFGVSGPAIIADGGIKNSGDIVKALAAGADMVMLGSLLAGAAETPGEIRIDINGKRWRPYRGQSIFGTNDTKFTPEGIEGWVEEKGPVKVVLKRLIGGIRSGLSYVGATNLAELRENAEFIQVSSSTHIETHTRIITEVF